MWSQSQTWRSDWTTKNVSPVSQDWLCSPTGEPASHCAQERGELIYEALAVHTAQWMHHPTESHMSLLGLSGSNKRCREAESSASHHTARKRPETTWTCPPPRDGHCQRLLRERGQGWSRHLPPPVHSLWVLFDPRVRAQGWCWSLPPASPCFCSWMLSSVLSTSANPPPRCCKRRPFFQHASLCFFYVLSTICDWIHGVSQTGQFPRPARESQHLHPSALIPQVLVNMTKYVKSYILWSRNRIFPFPPSMKQFNSEFSPDIFSMPVIAFWV